MFRTRILMSLKRTIVNENAISCITCVFFKTVKNGSVMMKDHIFLCIKQGEKNLATDDIYYPNAVSCRKDETICGIEAKNYIEKKLCNDCIYVGNGEYDSVCNKFLHIHEEPMSPTLCRHEESLCGLEGKFYSEK